MLDHQGEPRETRLKEVIEMDPGRVIIALREGPYLVISGQSMQLKGETGGLIFKYDREPLEIASGDELSHLLTI